MQKVVKGLLLVALVCVLCLVFPYAGKASTPLPSSVYVTQQVTGASGTCTLASATMMMRARAYLSGYADWAGITESAVKGTAWVDKGLRNSFTYFFSDNSISVRSTNVSGITINNLKKLLDKHPEGIVLYFNPGSKHAVFVTDYEGDTFFCSDPYPGYTSRRTLAQTCKNCSQETVLKNTIEYWYVSSSEICDINGVLDAVIRPDNNHIRIYGWAYDRTGSNTTIEIHTYIGGPAGSGAECKVANASNYRKDLGKHCGYDLTYTVENAYRTPVYVYAVNTATGFNVLLDPKNREPRGNIESLEGRNGSIYIKGWVFDPDIADYYPQLHVYVGMGANSNAEHRYIINTETCKQSRPDVSGHSDYEEYEIGDYHGFEIEIPVTERGSQDIYIYAINNERNSSNPLLPLQGGVSRTVTIGGSTNRDPTGNLDEYAGRAGAIYVRGWAKDDDTPDQSVYVDVYVGGAAGSGAPSYRIKADKSRSEPDGNYGFDEIIPVSVTGNQSIYLYALNTDNGNNPVIGSATVSIAEPAYLDVGFTLDGQDTPPLDSVVDFTVRIGDENYTHQDHFVQQVSEGVSYEVKDIQFSTVHVYKGVTGGAFSGTMGSSDISIRLNFASTYAVRYDKNTTDTVYNMPLLQREEKGVPLILTENVPNRMGYRFQGWSLSSSGTEAAYQPGDIYTAVEDVTLYALWMQLDELKLPEDLEVIEGQAFYGSAAECVTVPRSVRSIGRQAFGNCKQLVTVKIFANTDDIEPDAFDECSSGLTIYCEMNSAAHSLAQQKGINFVLIWP